MAKSAQQAFDKYMRNASNAAQSYAEGVAGVEQSPTAQAAEAVKSGHFLRKVNEAVSSGRMEKNLRKVTREAWIEAASTKGADRLASGIAASADKTRRVFDKLVPAMQRIGKEARAMPKGTPQDALNRVKFVMDNAAKLKGTLGE